MGENDAKILKELDALKRLMILLLIKLGSDSKELAMALDIGDSTIRGMMSMRQVKKVDFEKGDE